VSSLVVSDLHLGSRLRHDVLTHPEPLNRLLEALEGVERLVLLGDIVELLEERADRANVAPMCNAFALTDLNADVEARIGALVKKAVSA